MHKAYLREVCGRSLHRRGLLIRSGSFFGVREIVSTSRFDIALCKAIRSRTAFFCPERPRHEKIAVAFCLSEHQRGLGMSQPQIMFHNVSFAHETASAPLITGLTAHFQTGWTGIVGVNGAGKTSLLQLATGELSPQSGTIQKAGKAIHCPQRTDTAPALFAEFMQASEGGRPRNQGAPEDRRCVVRPLGHSQSRRTKARSDRCRLMAAAAHSGNR